MEKNLYRVIINNDNKLVDNEGEVYTSKTFMEGKKGYVVIFDSISMLGYVLYDYSNLYNAVYRFLIHDIKGQGNREITWYVEHRNIILKRNGINAKEEQWWVRYLGAYNMTCNDSPLKKNSIKAKVMDKFGSKYLLMNHAFKSDSQKEYEVKWGLILQFKKDDKRFINGSNSDSNHSGATTDYIPSISDDCNIANEMSIRITGQELSDIDKVAFYLKHNNSYQSAVQEGFELKAIFPELKHNFVVMIKQSPFGKGTYKRVIPIDKTLEEILELDNNTTPQTKEETLSQWQENYRNTGSLFFPNT